MPLPRRRILCCEDDKDICEVLSTILGQAGYEVKSASTSAEALCLAKCEIFDLYLLDNKLPDGMGTDLCRKIRQFDPGTPIVFFSALASDLDQRRGLEAGAQAYLVKPFGLEALAIVIKGLIAEHAGASLVAV